MLLDKLRQHTVAIDFLELWAPDTDSVKGILGMVDAAWLAGKPAIGMIREIREEYAQRTNFVSRQNDFEPLPSNAWLAKNTQERRDAI